jgi:DNA segregation ATPase FtsK/SpoIIIE-like protein
VAETQRCSTSWLQRKMTIGYNRAAKIVEMLEKRGMVGPRTARPRGLPAAAVNGGGRAAL